MENTTMFGGSLWIWVIFIGFTVISWLISHQLKSRFQKYSKIPTANGMTGRDVVEKMLRDNGVTGVKIGSVEGMLTDHYHQPQPGCLLRKQYRRCSRSCPRNGPRPAARQRIQYA